MLRSRAARLAQAAARALEQQQQRAPAAAGFATRAAPAKRGAPKDAGELVPATDWKAVQLPAPTVDGPDGPVPTTTLPGQAFLGDMRSTSGLGKGDGINNHTEKWLQGTTIKSPLQYIQEAEPIEVHAPVVASHGSDDPALGCPVEFINLKGTSRERPAVCKYTGNKYFAPQQYWRAH